jgi:hypothetical protein
MRRRTTIVSAGPGDAFSRKRVKTVTPGLYLSGCALYPCAMTHILRTGRILRTGLVALATAWQAGPAFAQAGESAVRSLDALAACRAILTDGDRLACYDRIATRIASARDSGELLVFDRQKVEAERRVRFGLVDPPEGSDTPAPREAARVTEIETTVKAVTPGAERGVYLIDLANGQRWRTLETISVEPRVGAVIRLATTVTGGFRASVARGRAFGVRRVR